MPGWGYTESNGPSTWAKDCFTGSMGKRQSPIDIKTSEAKYDSDLTDEPLTTKYVQERNIQLKNNGHSIMCQISSENKSVLTGGPLKGDTYRLEQFHLHWGSKDDKGSEHTIDGKEYAAELHLVHWNSSKYPSFGEAASKGDGLAVLGIMVKVGSENQVFKTITNHLDEMVSINTDKTFDTALDPAELLPNNTSQYWTYEGSLTTPPLFESVQWIVFKEPVEYSPDQMKKLRSLKDADGHDMQDNFRPPLALEGRLVRASFQ
ncbi:carbonic anhydrase-like [Ruditapes philippinarum]|uniref:carbonic anhydrase-like n=1 Tax=Ruditapes philippinarum TaxID=129788 RepID=UPI00295B250C|nr:carbonic anhydrase-like [Ruditapes philippinarum]